MRHGVKTKKLGVDAQHKRAILRSLATSIILKGLATEQIERPVKTTLHKAKMIRSVVDRLITYAKKGDLSARREAARFVMDSAALQGLFDVLGPRYANRAGGYTRVLKLGPNRVGDAAEMALVTLVENEVSDHQRPVSKKPASTKKVDMVKGEASTEKAEA